MRCFSSLTIAHPDVLHCAADRLVAETLPHEGEVHVAGNQVGGQGVLEDVRMPLLWRKSGSLSAGSKDAEKLGAIEPAAFLADKQIIAAVLLALAEPCPDRVDFVQQRLPSMLVERLDLAE